MRGIQRERTKDPLATVSGDCDMFLMSQRENREGTMAGSNSIGVGLGPNSTSNFARKLGLVVYLIGSSVSVDTIFVNICYLFNGLQKKERNILYKGNDAYLLSECRH